MAVGLKNLRSALAAKVDAETEGIRCYARIDGQVQLPAFAVLPGADPYVDRDETMGRGLVTVRLDGHILVATSSVGRAQDQLDDLIDTVTDAILTGKRAWLTANGVGSDIVVDSVSSPQDGELSGHTVLFCVVEIRVLVDDS